MSLNDEISTLFLNLSALMELRGDNVFKVIAFQKVGRIVRDLNIDLKKCIEENKLCEVEGIGKGSQQIIEEFVSSGKSTVYEEVTASVPGGLVPMMQIEGLGPKTINLFWKTLDITSLEGLEKAIASGKLEGIKGLGEKKIATIKKGIEDYKSRLAGGTVTMRTGIVYAMEQAQPLLEAVRKMPGVIRAEIAGSLRRRCETIGDVDLIAAADMQIAAKVIEQFTKLPGVIQTLGAGESKGSVKVSNGMQVDLRVVPEENFGAALLYFTGSKQHNVKIRGLSLKKKMTLNEWGLYKLDEYEKAEKKTAQAPKLKPVASKSEADVYKKLGMEFVEPELREDRGEVEAALSGTLPKLIELADYRGDLHTHTTASDGTASIEEMAQAAIERGYEFLAITDHSKAQAIANGLSVERLLAHIKEIRKVSERLKFKILAGSEVDIMVDGRMDYEDAVLAELDFVVASPHISLKQDSAKATDRLVRAIESKYVNVIGHPTGRLINKRAGLSPDMPRLFKAAAATGTALEINASYPRLDLNDVNARGAIDAGCMLSINTDSHSTEEFDQIGWGISVARRGWVTKNHAINCMKFSELMKFIAKKR
jgi:DNA polymerase (family 10)